MNYFFQAAAGSLVACILCLTLDKKGKDFSILITVAVCSMTLLVAVTYMEPVLEFIRRLEAMGNMDNQMLVILLKAVGIGLLSDIASMICIDSGNASMGKALHILSTVIILWLSIPIFDALLDLLQKILGEI